MTTKVNMIQEYKPDRNPLSGATRVVCWFSCGSTSAVATKMTLNKYKDLPVVIAYCDTNSEHPDNYRFLKDCEQWFGQEVVILRSKKYTDIWDVFEKTRWLVGTQGARCTYELKTKPRLDFEVVEHDIQVYGYDASERNRADRYVRNYPEVAIHCPLIDEGLDKNDCKDILLRFGLELPKVYEDLPNANCIGCVKGQGGYWSTIKEKYPEVFKRMSILERDIGAAINKTYAGDGKRKRIFLDELPEGFGRDIAPKPIQCGLFCEDVL